MERTPSPIENATERAEKYLSETEMTFHTAVEFAAREHNVDDLDAIIRRVFELIPRARARDPGRKRPPAHRGAPPRSNASARTSGGTAMPDCLHCGGTGEEPFGDGEQCPICCGETTVPESINREYHGEIQEALGEVPARRREPVAWRWEARARGVEGWHETHQSAPPEEFYGEQASRELEWRDVTPLFEREEG